MISYQTGIFTTTNSVLVATIAIVKKAVRTRADVLTVICTDATLSIYVIKHFFCKLISFWRGF